MRTYAVVLASVITTVAILFGVFITRVAAYSSPERYFQKGKRNYEVQNYEDAINNFNEYLSIRSRRKTEENIAEANFLVADSLKNLKKYTLAKQKLSDIINDPKYISYYTNAILAYADIARLENTPDAYLMVKLQNNLNTSDKSVASTINMQYGYQLLFSKRYGEALSYFLRSDGELALLGRARAYFEMGEFDRAFEIYKDFLVYYKNSAYYSEVMRTYLIQVPARAHRYFVDKNYSKARMYYNNIAMLFPTTEHGEEALFRIAQSYYTEQNYKLGGWQFGLGLTYVGGHNRIAQMSKGSNRIKGTAASRGGATVGKAANLTMDADIFEIAPKISYSFTKNLKMPIFSSRTYICYFLDSNICCGNYRIAYCDNYIYNT